jgi:hypothetical protein
MYTDPPPLVVVVAVVDLVSAPWLFSITINASTPWLFWICTCAGSLLPTPKLDRINPDSLICVIRLGTWIL